MKKFRINGAIGALLDEYEKALHALQKVLSDVTDRELATIVDHQAQDPDCRSIQSILSHVIRSGYCYVIYIRRHLGEKMDFVDRIKLDSPKKYQLALDKMLKFNEQLFEDYPDLKLEEVDNQKKILTNWGQLYDVEQLLEHAIVHVLRHRRQIEKFLIKLREPE